MLVEELFFSRFGEIAQIVAVAPGRVNLIGEHTDYNEGFVFPVAIDRYVKVAIGVTDGESKLYSKELGDGVGFNVNKLSSNIEGWSKYVAGMAYAFIKLGISLPNVRMVVSSNLPIGIGVSSSAALEMAAGLAWLEAAGTVLPEMELAKAGQLCENEYVGVNSGIMDQAASACAHAGCAMFLDTKSLEATHAFLPDDLAIVLCDTQTPRSLTTSVYNERRDQCRIACEIMAISSLRYARLEDLDSAWDKMPEVVFRRAHHVITENARCIGFVDALDKNNRQKIHMLMRASHESLRDNYEVSSEALDVMAEAAWDAPGCIGARMTGAGFGGACVALVEADRTDAFLRSVQSRYQTKTGRTGEYLLCKAVAGAHFMRLAAG